MFIKLSHDEIGVPKLYGLNKSFHKNQLLYDIDGTDEMTEANLKKWETRKRCKNLPPLPPLFSHYSTTITMSFWREETKKLLMYN